MIIVFFAAFWLMKEIVAPAAAALLFSKAFMENVYECDTAMEASWYYSQQDSFNSKADVVQLLSCHEYDKARKVMLMAGLPEAYLSWLGLKSLELYQRSPEEFVMLHRFTER